MSSVFKPPSKLMYIIAIFTILVLSYAIYLYINNIQLKRNFKHITPRSNDRDSTQSNDNVNQSHLQNYQWVDFDDADINTIKALLAQRQSQRVENISTKINISTGNLIKGVFSIAGEQSEIWFLAVRKDTSWIIVDIWDKNPSCQAIVSYNFSREIVPMCYDIVGDVLILR